MTRRNFGTALFLLIFIQFLAACQGRPAEDRVSVPSDAVGPQAESAGPILFWLEGEPIREGEFRTFVRENITNSEHHGAASLIEDADFLRYLDAYKRYRLVLREAERLRLSEDPFYRRALRAARLAVAGRLYFKELAQTLAIDPEKIKARLPDPWTEMTFRMKVFPDMASAQAARDTVKTGEDFEKVAGSMALRPGKDVSDTKPLFRDSGFFDPLDDAYLYTLKEGEISRPVVSGLGAALALVVKRHDFTPEEQSTYLGEVRKELGTKAAVEKVQELEKELGLEVMVNELQASAVRELIGYPPPEYLVLKVGQEEIPYRAFRYLATVNLRDIASKVPREGIGRMLAPEVKSFGQNVLLGLDAERAGFAPAQLEDPAGPLAAVSRKIMYDQAMLLLRRSMPVKAPDDGEVEAFYRANPANFQRTALAQITYYFSPDRTTLERLLRQYQQGMAFDSLRFRSGEMSGAHGSSSWPKTVYTWRDDDRFPEIKGALFGMKEGEVRLLDGQMGFYLVRLRSIRPKGTIPLVDVAQEIGERLLEERRNEAAARFVGDALGKMEVKFTDRPQEERPDIKRPDLG